MLINEHKFAKSVAQNCQDAMRQICMNLSQYFGIDHFSYIKCFADGTHFSLNTHNEWMKIFYLNRYKEYDVFYKTIDAYTSGISL